MSRHTLGEFRPGGRSAAGATGNRMSLLLTHGLARFSGDADPTGGGMKSVEYDVLANARDDVRSSPAGLSRRELFLKGGVAMAVTQALGAEAKAAGATRKIALEEHFSTPELAKKYVARPTRSDTLFADIERRLADFDQLRLETMDKAGIDLVVLSVTTPGVQAEKDTKTAIRLAREANDLLAREVQ